jgi:cleavage stimulation factor subunit 3
MELETSDFYRAEQIFNRSLLNVPNVDLWSVYLGYVQRRNNLATDTTGNARSTISQAYEFVLDKVGQDRKSGTIWRDYLTFIKNGPGVVGGSSWQDQQKMDLLRKTYQKAVCVPVEYVDQFWKEYEAFEMGLNKITGRKFVQEKSPAYMTARGANVELTNITEGLDTSTLPRLPPLPGFEGDVDYIRQVNLWKRWITWEIEDPLVLKDEELPVWKARVLYTYKQALMTLRFWPEMWFDAAEFCLANEMETDAVELLNQGILANTESSLLTFKLADYLETSTAGAGGGSGAKRRGETVRTPYDKHLDSLYELLNTVKAREAKDISLLEGIGQSDEEASLDPDQKAAKAAKDAHVQSIKDSYAKQIQEISKQISFVWIALMRAMRRIQGQGKVGAEIGGSRQVFADARKRGRVTSDVYIASALIEHHCYQDPAGTKIFERGVKLFPQDEYFALEHLKLLISLNDITNARAVFEAAVTRLPFDKAESLFAYFHQIETCYGESSQIIKLERRIRDLYPYKPALDLFAHRFNNASFDPTTFRPLLSPLTQTRPKGFIMPTASRQNSPNPATIARNSPKRALPTEDTPDIDRPRKFVRAESPLKVVGLKGAAGRKLDQAKRLGTSLPIVPEMAGTFSTAIMPPAPLPRDVLFLLSIIPPAHTYNATKFKPEEVVKLLQNTNIPTSAAQLPSRR